jgi:branched-chain amino acid transport system ATP-binding protein
MLLEVDQINTYRGPAHVVHAVSITVNEKELVCMVGRNGAGRTTIIESITGLLPVRSGKVGFRGEDITRLPVHKRAAHGIGYAPENSGIFPELSVSENLMISRWLAEKSGRATSGNRDAEARVFTVFPEVRDLLNRQGINLSGGQRKMVAIARAMALSPYLLILDEAFEGLAPAVVKRFREAVKMIKEMGISVLIADCNLVRAADMADRLYAVDRGEIIFHGAPQEALNNEEVMRTLRG